RAKRSLVGHVPMLRRCPRLFLFPRHPLAFLACLGERDGDRLFAAFHPAALSTLAAFRFAPLVTVHLTSHLLAGALRVFSFPFLSHSNLLTTVIQRRLVAEGG